MKRLKRILAAVLAAEVIMTLVVSYNIKTERKRKEELVSQMWFNNYSLVAHGLGGVDGLDYTNSLEAFKSQYEQGTRIFEVDLALTSDGKLVLTHGWLEHKEVRLGQQNADRSAMSYDEFMSQKIYGKYTPLSSLDLIEIMKEYPDIYVVLDWGKDLDYDEETGIDAIFEIDELMKRNQILIDQFKAEEESLLQRVIPQIYYEEHFKGLDQLYHFENYIYTLYKNFENTSAKEALEFAQKNGIDVIVSNLLGDQALITEEIRRLINNDRTMKQEMGVYLHTINDLEEAKDYIEAGYKGIFTDNLTQYQLNEVLSGEEDE